MSDSSQPGPIGADVKIFLLSTITLSVALWDIAFNYGVYDTVFFDKVFTVWAASTAALLASLFVPPPPDRNRLIGWRGRFVLLLPTVWVLFDLVSGEPLVGGPTDVVLSALTLVVALVTLPYTVYIVVVFVTPDLVDLKSPRYIAATLIIVAIIGIVGFAVGRNNDLFLTCGDFTISGNDTPARCTP